MNPSTNNETLPVNAPQAENVQPESIPPSEETPANPIIEEMIVSEKAHPRRRGCARVWVLWTLIALLLLCIIAGLSGWGGYRAGNQMRQEEARQATRGSAQTQFAMAMQDIDAGRYRLLPTRLASFQQWPPDQRDISADVALELQVQFELAQTDVQEKRYEAARLRLEWIIEWNPGFPGVTDLLAEAIYQMSITATPTLAPTPTPVPATATPDLRGVETLYSDAQQAIIGGNWTVAIETLLTLRKHDENYNAVQVDDLLYVAYRYRGLDKIEGSGKTDPTITNVDLEGGIYDLKLAEGFGPLDNEALKYRRWAQWYIAGSSFWNVDWKRAVDYFALVENEAPYLMDVNNWPAIERYRYALIKYGDHLAAMGDCAGASEQYQKALDLGPNPALEPTATAVAEECGPSAPVETPITPATEPPPVATETSPWEPSPTSPSVPATAQPSPTLTATVPPLQDTPTYTPESPQETPTATSEPLQETPTSSPPPSKPSVTPTP
jgi:predicted negative regulator of RcsB-dependent stress response